MLWHLHKVGLPAKGVSGLRLRKLSVPQRQLPAGMSAEGFLPQDTVPQGSMPQSAVPSGAGSRKIRCGFLVSFGGDCLAAVSAFFASVSAVFSVNVVDTSASKH